MEKFNTLSSIPAYMPILNIDTDMIIPKQFLKTIKRTGLGKNLFFEMRYDDKGKEINDFVLNQNPFNNSKILKDKKKASHVHAMVVPGSGLVKEQAEQEGLDKIFLESGFEWREPGCSMCLAMNADKLKPEERCASTSNRNFEGRQGRGGRTHLVSPGMAAAAAISGNLDDVRKYQN